MEEIVLEKEDVASKIKKDACIKCSIEECTKREEASDADANENGLSTRT